jgi:hypothetical protein
VTGSTAAALLHGVPMLLTSMPPSIARHVLGDGFTVE